MAVTLTNRPTLIEAPHTKLRFLIMDAPSDTNMPLYLKEFNRHNVTHVVRVCQNTYSKEALVRTGIKFYEMAFDDGSSPPSHILQGWLDLVNEVFPDERKGPSSPKIAKKSASSPSLSENGSSVSLAAAPAAPPAIAVHCVAGLGRAPVLVAIALMEREGMGALETIDYIRKRRRGAINQTQMTFLEKYVPRAKRKKCIIM